MSSVPTPKSCKWPRSFNRKRKYNDRNMVTLIVGPEQTRFHIYEDLLCEVSPFFRAAFGSHFREGLEKTMDLPEDSPEIVNYFCEWLNERAEHKPKYRSESTDCSAIRHCVELYIFGEKIQVERLRNETMNQLGDCMICDNESEFLSPEMIRLIYENTHKESQLRKLATFVWTWDLDPLNISSPENMALLDVSTDFKNDALLSLAKALDSCRQGIKDGSTDNLDSWCNEDFWG